VALKKAASEVLNNSPQQKHNVPGGTRQKTCPTSMLELD